jgi:hypothetical protein
MKTLNKTLLLLAGIAANVLLACGTDKYDTDQKPPYAAEDTLHKTEYINTPDSAKETFGTPDNAIDKPEQ